MSDKSTKETVKSLAKDAYKTVKIVAKHSDSPIFATKTMKMVTGPVIGSAVTAYSASETYKKCVADYKAPVMCAVAGTAGLVSSLGVGAVGAAITSASVASIPATGGLSVPAATLGASGGAYVAIKSGDVGKCVHDAMMSLFVKSQSAPASVQPTVFQPKFQPVQTFQPPAPVPIRHHHVPFGCNPLTYNPHSIFNNQPVGVGWERGVFPGEYYRKTSFLSNSVEKWSNGFTSYVSSSDPGLSFSSRMHFGGVKMESEQVSKVFDILELDNTNGDPISIDYFSETPCLTFRDVKYVVPNINQEELASAIFLVFFMKSNNIGVTMDPNTAEDNLVKIFKPSIMGQLDFGRTLMDADVLLKDYMSQHYVDFRKEEYIRKETLGPTRVRFWFETSNIVFNTDKTNGIVTFTDNDMKVLYNETDNIDESAIKFCKFMNDNMTEMLRKHECFRKMKTYMNLISMCKLLFVASNNTICDDTSYFVETFLKPKLDAYDQLYPMKKFMRNVKGHNICILSGGVTMISRALMLTKPWRRGNAELDKKICERCKWCIESYMEATMTIYGFTCQGCREELNLKTKNVKYDGIDLKVKNVTPQIQMMMLAVNQRKALIEQFTPKLVSITDNNELSQILDKFMALIQMKGITYTFEEKPNNTVFYKIVIHD